MEWQPTIKFEKPNLGAFIDYLKQYPDVESVVQKNFNDGLQKVYFDVLKYHLKRDPGAEDFKKLEVSTTPGNDWSALHYEGHYLGTIVVTMVHKDNTVSIMFERLDQFDYPGHMKL
jgi:hypothetical protein